MSFSKSWIFAIVGLLIGSLGGYIAAFAIYQPQINEYVLQVDNLESLLSTTNSSLIEAESTISNLDTQISNLQLQISEMPKVFVINDQEYYNSLKHDIEKANETILVAMYTMKYDPGDASDWVNNLIEELLNAKNRGVNVTAIIEYITYFGPKGENLAAYNYLLGSGVSTQLDYDSETDHFKLVVIDDKIVYVGSHNWSEAGLYHNRETSVRIVSKNIAEVFKAYFEMISTS